MGFNKCSGSSKNLAPAQCDAWIAFYDATAGPCWKRTGVYPSTIGDPVCNGTRTDPCACRGFFGSDPVCNTMGTAVTKMCARPLRRCAPAPLTLTHVLTPNSMLAPAPSLFANPATCPFPT
jgi:hypothetical protein